MVAVSSSSLLDELDEEDIIALDVEGVASMGVRFLAEIVGKSQCSSAH